MDASVVLFADSPAPSLVGIARLAASGKLLEAKRRVDYRDLPTRRFITRCQSERVPFDWTINPYRGCEFGCKYCYARYTHEFMELREPEDFETKIFAKQWNPAGFRDELGKIDSQQWIAIGTATDPYQPAERRYRTTRRILEILACEKGRRFSITTKSDLVAGDLDLLEKISATNILQVAITITTLDEKLARLVEPYAPRPALRMEAVRRLSEAGIRVGVFACPILPLLNDSESMLGAVARGAAKARAAYFGGGVLFLKPCTHGVFFPFLDKHFPALAKRYRRRFRRNAFLTGAYPEMIKERLERVRVRHGLAKRFPDYRPDLWPEEMQLELPFPSTFC